VDCMSQSKRELVEAALENKKVDRIPVGFWFHFVENEDKANVFVDSTVTAKNIEGHRAFYEAFEPDFVKLMSDGYFIYPHPAFENIHAAADFATLKPLGKDHPWIEKQVLLVKELQKFIKRDVYTFYNIFAPARVLEWSLPGYTKELLGDLIEEDSLAVKKGLDVIAQDIATLSERIIKEGEADGIYFSVQNIDDERITKEVYLDVFAPGEQRILKAANEANPYNILHICGYDGHHNDLSWYVDYDAKAYNWAAVVENISLAEGKKIFSGKAVIGGFGNTTEDILYKGDEAAIKNETHRLIAETGREGILLGADCTVPRGLPLNRLEWVRSAAKE